MRSPTLEPSLRAVREGSASSLSITKSRPTVYSIKMLQTGGEYNIIKKIGSGNFGEIWLASCSSQNQHYVAVKIEKSKRRFSQLQLEYKCYKLFGKNNYTPLIYHFYQNTRFSALIMELLGPSLEDLFVYNNSKFSQKTVLLLSMQLLRIFQFVHDHGIIYRDVKPQNFLLCTKTSHQHIVIIDFGLAKEYVNPLTKVHIPYAENISLTGTARYMSINTHLGRQQSRRDDLESVGHMLLYFLLGKLPWQGLKIHDAQVQYRVIGEIKCKTSIDELCQGLPVIWGRYLCYCRNLEFTEKPDYSYLYSIFSAFYENQNYNDYSFDWRLPIQSNLASLTANIHQNSVPVIFGSAVHDTKNLRVQSYSYPSLANSDVEPTPKLGHSEQNMTQFKSVKHAIYPSYISQPMDNEIPDNESYSIKFFANLTLRNVFSRFFTCLSMCFSFCRRRGSVKKLSNYSSSCDFL